MNVISSMATRHLLVDLADAAAARGLPRPQVESYGGVDAAQRVSAGQAYDVVVLAGGAIDTLARSRTVDAGSVVPVAVSQVAVAVPAAGATGAALPASSGLDNAADVRAALHAATRIGYSTGPSGTALVRLIDEWGMSEEITPKLVQAAVGIPVAQSVAEGAVDLGFQQLSELVGQPGIRIIGTLPEDCAITTVFAGAIAQSSSDSHAARALLDFFGTDEARRIIAAHNFDPPSRSSS